MNIRQAGSVAAYKLAAVAPATSEIWPFASRRGRDDYEQWDEGYRERGGEGGGDERL